MHKPLLGLETLKVIQDRNQAFNLDTILLASFVKIPLRAKRILDVGTGTGVLMLYLSAKTKAHIYGVEIQKARYLNALESIKLNHLEDRLTVFHQDFKTLEIETLDAIVCNPPFFKLTEAKQNVDIEQRIARHELYLTLEELISRSSILLKQNGSLFMIHRPDRLIEIIQICHKHEMEVKKIQMVHPYQDKEANHVLIMATKKGNPGVKVLPPIIIYDDKHILSQQMTKIYKGEHYVTNYFES